MRRLIDITSEDIKMGGKGEDNMQTHQTRLHYKKLVDKIIDWLNSDIDKDNYLDNKEVQNAIAQNSADLKEKIDIYLDGSDEF